MTRFKPAVVSKGGFAFCRIVVAALLWLSLIFQAKWLVGLVFVIMLLSAILKVERAPLILLYKYTVRPTNNIVVDEKGIFFSHLVGAVFSLACLALLYFSGSPAAWLVTGLLAILQSSAACGFCSALKLYTCMTGGNCCRVGKLARKVRENARRP